MVLRDDERQLCIHVMLQQSGDPALKASVSLPFQIDRENMNGSRQGAGARVRLMQHVL